MSARAITATRPIVMEPRAASRLGAVSRALLIAFAFGLPVMRYVDVAGGRVNACAADLLLLPVLLLSSKRWLKSGALGYWIFGLWMVNVISWALSLSVLATSDFIRECLKLVTCYAYALAGFGIGREESSERALVNGLVWSVIPMAALALLAFFVRQPSFFIIESRVAGPMGDANAMGIYLGMMIPLIASLNLAWMLIPLFIAAGVVTFSRTGLVAIGASLALNSIHLGFRRYLLVVTACILVFVVVWGVASNTRVGKRIASYHGSLSEREALWRRAAEVTARHPLFGIGKGNWETVAGSRTVPHNTFLSVAAHGGLVGLAVFMAPLVVWLWRGMRRAACRRWAIAVFVGFVGGVAVSLDNFRPFWLAVGLLVAGLMATDRAGGGEQVRWT